MSYFKIAAIFRDDPQGQRKFIRLASPNDKLHGRPGHPDLWNVKVKATFTGTSQSFLSINPGKNLLLGWLSIICSHTSWKKDPLSIAVYPLTLWFDFWAISNFGPMEQCWKTPTTEEANGFSPGQWSPRSYRCVKTQHSGDFHPNVSWLNGW